MTGDEPAGSADYDESYWRQFRERARKRARMQGALVLGGALIAVAALVLIAPADHYAGPARIEPPFTLVFPGLLAVVGLAIIVRAVRWLRSDQSAPG